MIENLRSALVEAVLDDLCADASLTFTDAHAGTEYGIGFSLDADGDAVAFINPDHVALFGSHMDDDAFATYVEAVAMFVRSALELVPIFGFGDALERQIHLHMTERRPDLAEILHAATDDDEEGNQT